MKKLYTLLSAPLLPSSVNVQSSFPQSNARKRKEANVAKEEIMVA